jgi:uncharacterized membrane protein
MERLILGLAIFLGVHSVRIVAPAWRERMVARLGLGPWKGLYSLASLAGFVLIISGYGAARAQSALLYTPPPWTRYLALLLMLPVFALLLAAYLPGRIKSMAKHPMLVAIKLWAVAHLLTNGALADVLLFGGLLAWAVADRISVKRRPVPTAPTMKAAPLNDVIVVAGGLALYIAFLMVLHTRLFGVSPLG